MATSHCSHLVYWHISSGQHMVVVNFTLLLSLWSLTCSGQEWQMAIHTDIWLLAISSSGQNWQFQLLLTMIKNGNFISTDM